MAADALEVLARRPWPGNIRELRNVLEQAALMTDERVLHAADFGSVPAPQTAPALLAPAERVRTLSERVAELERQAIAEALLATGGNRVAAARRLGISRSVLYDRLARHPELAPRAG